MENVKAYNANDEEHSLTRQALPQILAVSVKNMVLLAFGMSLGFPTILIPSLSGNDISEKIILGQEELSWIGSVNMICIPVGCLLSGSITHVLGRKRSMQMVNFPFVAAWLLFHFSTNVSEVLLALCLTGISGGLLEAPVLTYVAEVTQPHLRGILSSLSSMSVMIGILSQFLLGTFINWRKVVLINCAVPILSFILLIFIPETPIWLITKSRNDEARKSIAWLRGWTKVENIENEFQELYKQTKSESSNNLTILKKLNNIKLFGKRNFIWPYVIVCLCFFLGHFNGNTTLQIYAIQIFSVLQVPIDKYYSTVLIGVVQLLGSIACVIFIHIIGKRKLTFISLFGSGICFLIVATYAYINEDFYLNSVSNFTLNNATLNKNTSNFFTWVPITFLVLSAFFTYLGIKILPWILIGEVFSTEIRATASGLSAGIGYIFGFIANKIFLSSVSQFTLPGVFGFFGIVGLIGIGIIYRVLPETEGKSLFEITEHFAGRSKLRNSVRKKKHHFSGQNNKAFEPDILADKDESKL